ncbi:hypothetical protein, conserved [Babesia bigemina]|uniref:Uncharacterized protein n=1 Tax=Babesia bigemina TaxID=5866 RepID=A0A061D7U7_BABBI|nr:hypothetical protein, conserved [Babesia bigemina]CDR94984.1 hypothetical protein, conserved [Babesia bigemina]|eukprot:XP_012767170.1 hypothetical protein, conserved [Babesia bigemina]
MEDDKAARQDPLPSQCSFTMQQWLYRRTPHTKRYKRCYIMLHHNRLYTFRKPPPFRECEPPNVPGVFRHATASWMIAGAELKAESHSTSGLYKWRITVKPIKQYAGEINPALQTVRTNTALVDAEEAQEGLINDIFKDINAGNNAARTARKPYADDSTVWLATSNHKVASDWLLAILWTTRYGSLQNFVEQNQLRSKYVAYGLPTYLLPIEFFPKSENVETMPRRKAAFTFMKLSVVELLQVYSPAYSPICCVVEHNSSFYVLNLPRQSPATHIEVPRVMSYLSTIDEESHADEVRVQHPGDRPLRVVDMNSGLETIAGKDFARASTLDIYKPESTEAHEDERVKTRAASSLATTPQQQGYNMLSKLWHLNKTSDKKKVVMAKQSYFYGDEACLYIPMYQHTCQDYVWMHFIAANDVYLGSAALSNCHFSINEPATLKTCVLKQIEAVNPLNQKRIDISDHPNPESVVNTSAANAKVPEAGYVVLSVVTPKHFGNFLDPVALSHNSPQEYIANATKASTAGGLQMLTSNIKRVVAAYRNARSVLGYMKRVIHFTDASLSFAWLIYFIAVLGVYSDKLLLFIIVPLAYCSLRSHPDSARWVRDLLLRYPLLIALLPQRLTEKFLLLPKSVCMVCTKRKAFLQTNSHTVSDVVTRSIAAEKVQMLDLRIKGFISSYGKGSPKQQTQIARIEHREPPMLTEKQAMNAYVSYTAHAGTRHETCSHRGVLHTYLAGLFLSQMDTGSLSNLLQTDGKTMLRAIHTIFYQPPPYPWEVVPWVQNVVLTVKYFAMAALLTFAGGINNIQTLHLLHRNRVATKLNVEAVAQQGGVAHPAQREQQEQELKTNHVPPVAEITEWYENERKSVFGTYSKHNLRFYDRPHVSAEDGGHVVIPDFLLYHSDVVVNKDTDENGWVYAKNWNSAWSKETHAFAFVRRRKWVVTGRSAGNVNRGAQGSMARVLTLSPMKRYAVAPEMSRGSSTKADERDIQPHDLIHIKDRAHSKPRVLVYKKGTKALEIDQYHVKNPSESGATSVDHSPTNRGYTSTATGTNRCGGAESTAPPQNEHDASRNKRHSSGSRGGRFRALVALKRGIYHFKRSPQNISDASPSHGSRSKPQQYGESKCRFNFLKLKKRTKRDNNVEDTADLDSDREIIPFAEHTVSPREAAAISFAEPLPVAFDRPEVNVQAESVEEWLTDCEEEETEPTPPRRSWLQNIFTFALTLLPCVVLDMFKVFFTVAWIFISCSFSRQHRITWQDDDTVLEGKIRPAAHAAPGGGMPFGCVLTTHAGKYAFHIRRPRKGCFMGNTKLRIYNAAKGHQCRLQPFSKYRQIARSNVIFLHTRQCQLVQAEHDPEDDDFEIFSMLSEDEVQAPDDTPTRMISAAVQESEESDAEETSSESNTSEGMVYQFSLETDGGEIDLSAIRVESKDSQDFDSARAEPATTPQEQHNRRGRLYSYFKSIYVNKIRKRQPEFSCDPELEADEPKELSDYDELESDEEMETEHKITMLGMLRKARDQIVLGNYYLNLFAMRYEKFLNMFSWRHPRVTQLIILMCASLAIGNYFVGVSTMLLVYVLCYFKSGFVAGTWERNIRLAVERHIDSCLDDLDIHRPLWDLNSRQVAALTQAIHGFSQVEVPSTLIRESATRRDIAQAVTAKIIEQKLCMNWERRGWFRNLFRHSPTHLDR